MKFTLDEQKDIELKVPNNNVVIPSSITNLPVSTSELGYVIGFLLFHNMDAEGRRNIENRIWENENLRSILLAILEVPQNKKTFKALCRKLECKTLVAEKFSQETHNSQPQITKQDFCEKPDTVLYYFNKRGSNAYGYPVIDTVNGTVHFVVKAGSTIRKELMSSGTASVRRQLGNEGVIDNFTFVKDYMFQTPSAAAAAICGAASNGWVEWTTDSGVPLDALRKKDRSEKPDIPSKDVENLDDVLENDILTESPFDDSIQNDLFFFNELGAKATAHITVDRPNSSIKITVHKGATISKRDNGIGRAQRQHLEQDSVLVNGQFTVDYTFGSPTKACMVLAAIKGNGYLKWKNADGISLEQVYKYLFNSNTDLL